MMATNRAIIAAAFFTAASYVAAKLVGNQFLFVGRSSFRYFVSLMRTTSLLVAVLSNVVLAAAQAARPNPTPSFPAPSFVLHDQQQKHEESRVVLGPMKTDSRGVTTGSFAVYGGSSLVQVSSLSFSADGKLLAVGSTPNRVDLWDVENRKKIRSVTAGTTVALSPDGRLLATNGRGIELWDVASGKLKESTKWVGDMIWAMTFDAGGTRLLVSSNGQNDIVFDAANGERLATLEGTQRGQFSADGSVVVGGNWKHIVVWSTKDWKQVRELPNGPDYVTRFAIHPGNDFVVVGGPNSARLVQLSSAKEIAKLGGGYTNFAAFTPDGSVIFTYPSSGFSLWDRAGKRYCTKPELGNGTVALSRDGRWLAAAPVGGGTTDVMLWDVNSILAACGIPAQAAH